MNDLIIKQISSNLNIKELQVKNVLTLLQDGATIPFIARYRKEVTGGLVEVQIKEIFDVYKYQESLLKRKEDIIRLIDEKGLLTEDLKVKILDCNKLVDVEDLYRPYKEKKKTKASDAIEAGLLGLAKIVMSFPDDDLDNIILAFSLKNEMSLDERKNGVKYIIAEWISDNAIYRKWIRNYLFNKASITSKIKKGAVDLNKTYEMYYDYCETIRTIKPHRVLALNRGENEKILSVSINNCKDEIISYLNKQIIKKEVPCVILIKEAILDSYKRLIFPSIEREIRSELSVVAEDRAIENFGKNLESLLLAPPLKEKNILAFDPGYINGCKLAVIDKTGKYLDSLVIKPFLNNVSSNVIKNCRDEVLSLIKKYSVDVIAIGNGTASRESEKFVSDMIRENGLTCKFVIVSEAGASIYSASKVALEEFPLLAVEKRSAVSIGRRLQDPLSELVKIPPEGIGVGLYQHDVSLKKLKESLDFVVSSAVNSVGVNINTASSSLLKYVSGITKKNIDKIICYREKVGKILSRSELKTKKILSDKVYEQAIGFLRVVEGDNLLDVTSIHPESYNIAFELLKVLELDIKNIGTPALAEKLSNLDVSEYASILGTDIYTLGDIIKSLSSPNRDPRDDMPQPILKSDILDIKDLRKGMKIQGTVRNVIDFGAFVDIGLHDDGLIHISQLSDKYVKHPTDVLNVGDIIDCYVLDVNLDRKKVALTLKEM